MITVRPATLDDVEGVRAIGHRTWPVAYAELATPEFIEDGLARYWSAGAIEWGIRNGITLVAVDTGSTELVGMAGLGQEDGFWVMWKLYVLPGYQAGGVGKALLDGAIEALPAGTDQLLLNVLVGNEKAIGFYRRHGFREPERTPARELGDHQCWMGLDLDRT
ncbi:ribosomal protein S18 acetylase RimI-like enzyme [Kribbella amoyensis]|uniref:Ribosomal protein S18 acetylase RimI-like enzyme n=1 Tax=Kribbella amoyensis TaxID=996641 RepID=A0A561BY30_9ACTN|nr:GNAT family N-acetyltransferase [Kribbella amoyensis]TWD83632.1 ribosomal protein S18 acetylase RimI-like enzyme [Kribbella amoyensis]